MPPWMPGGDSAAYQGQERRIVTAHELDLIQRWVAGGAKLGHARDISPRGFGGTAPGTTVQLEPAHPYRPHAADGGNDDYHCFLLDPHLTQDAYVTSAVIDPQQASVCIM